MQTLYIDVYFLINFTVDILALYFASSFSGVQVGQKRLLLSSGLGGVFAMLILFLPEIPAVKIAASILGLIAIAVISSGKVSLTRKIKLCISFVMFSALFGGAVNYLWGIFDSYISDRIIGVYTDSVNRKMLIMAIAILISVGVFKMIVAFFGKNYNSSGSVNLEIKYFDKTVRTDAFVDTGNLAVDPMDMSPILFVKKNIASQLLPPEMIDLRDPDLLSKNDRKRVRLIPVSMEGKTCVVTGFKADSVTVNGTNRSELIKVTVAIDKEGESYGGYYALMPAVALDNGKI